MKPNEAIAVATDSHIDLFFENKRELMVFVALVKEIEYHTREVSISKLSSYTLIPIEEVKEYLKTLYTKDLITTSKVKYESEKCKVRILNYAVVVKVLPKLIKLSK